MARYVLGYLLWGISTALAVLGVLVSRGMLMRLFSITGAGRWVLGAIDRFGVFILGLIGFAFVLYCEYYYREGVRRRVLGRRFARVTAIEVAVLVVAYLVSLIIR